MKRYIIFEKETYYPSGGQDDISFMVDELDYNLQDSLFERYNNSMKFNYMTIEIWDLKEWKYVEAYLGNLVECIDDDEMARYLFNLALFDYDKENWKRIGQYSEK